MHKDKLELKVVIKWLVLQCWLFK